MSAAIEIRDLVVRYGDVIAVEHAALDVAAGTFAALVGPSGCGKTSILRAIAGFETPTQGTVSIGGEVVTFVPPERRHIGMMFQEGALFPHLSVADNVAFGATRERAAEMLRMVGLDALASRFPHELSGGQQQRVALARALAPSPRAILLDEPFGGLDASLRVSLREEVRQILRASKTTAILVTHDQEEALSIADQVSVMRRGRILQTGSARDIYDRPANIEVAALIGDANLFDAAIAGECVVTPFGTLDVDAADGPCIVRIRTEDLEVVERGAAGIVISSRFFGHDVVDEVRLDEGGVFRVRLPQSSAPAGSRVEIGLRANSLRVFPENGAPVEAHRRNVIAAS